MKERQFSAISGWVMLPISILLVLAVPSMIITAVKARVADPAPVILVVILTVLLAVFTIFGYFTVQPNTARVLILFGKYRGTERGEGFHWANPFSVTRGSVIQLHKYNVSLRARNFQTSTLKVNDLRGNPIDIAAVFIWRVIDTAEALFDVDDYQHYVEVQSEAALRHLANTYPYDQSQSEGTGETTLRDSGDKVTEALLAELGGRLSKAGVEVLETRITHLAYAPEIAALMLRRQQAEAIIAARQKIVHGAVSMVEMALRELSEKKIVELDDERKAAMVGNLLVVLCGEAEVQPVVNAGTLYH